MRIDEGLERIGRGLGRIGERNAILLNERLEQVLLGVDDRLGQARVQQRDVVLASVFHQKLLHVVQTETFSNASRLLRRRATRRLVRRSADWSAGRTG